MEILANPQLITLSLKYASKLERRRLVEKLMDLAKKITDENDDDLGVKVFSRYLFLNFFLFFFFQVLATPPEPPVRPVLKKRSLSVKSTTKNKVLKENEVNASPNLNNSTQNEVSSFVIHTFYFLF